MENDKLNLVSHVSKSLQAFNHSETSENDLPFLHIESDNSAPEFFPDLTENIVTPTDNDRDQEETITEEGYTTTYPSDIQKISKSSLSTALYFPDAKNRFLARLPFDLSSFPSMNEILDSDLSSLSSAQSTFINVRFSAEQKPDFFEQLGDVPNVQDISQDSSENSVVQMSKYSYISTGRFTDPLTGNPQSSDSNESQLDCEEEIPTQKEYEVEEEESALEFSFENFDDIYPQEKEQSQKEGKPVRIEELFEDIPSEFQYQSPLIGELTSPEILLPFSIQQFLDEILQEVIITYNDYQDVKAFRKKMDKRELFKHLWGLERELYGERKISIFLNRKATELFRRKGTLRFISADKSNIDELEEKYTDTLNYLDKILGEEKQIEKITREKIQELTITVHAEEEEAKREIQKFEKLVRDTLKCGSNLRLAEVVDHNLRSMDKIRREICEESFVLIQLQHTLTQFKMKIDELNDLGDGLCLAEYENLEYETRALGKKLEDRKRELLKYYGRFQKSVHTMAHFRFYKDTLGEKVRSQCHTLDNLMEEKDVCRKQLHGLKQKHDRMRRAIINLIDKSGLLSRPLLLRDYDETVKNIKIKRNSVETLRQMKTDIETKLKVFENLQNSRRCLRH